MNHQDKVQNTTDWGYKVQNTTDWGYKVQNTTGGKRTLTPLSPIPQYFSYIWVDSFIGGGNRSTRLKQPTWRRSPTNKLYHIMREIHTHNFSGNGRQAERGANMIIKEKSDNFFIQLID
jgi:hypothetical protein